MILDEPTSSLHEKDRNIIITVMKRLKELGNSQLSFNVDGGRCNMCDGMGIVKRNVYFLHEVYCECPQCKGQRYQEYILKLYYICIERNLELVKTSDYVIEMGSEGGVNGGKIIFQGRPERMLKDKNSITGCYIKTYLEN